MHSRLALLVVFLLPGQFSQRILAQERLPIIDMHMHANNTVWKDADGRPLSRPCNPRPCQGPPAQAETAEDVLRLTLETMDRNNIVLGFLSDRTLDNVYRWVDAAPGRFIASPSVRDPDLIDLDGLRKEYEAGRLGGLGELGIQYAGIAATDPKMEPFYSLAEEFDVPVLIHHHGTAGPSEQFRISIGHPEQLEQAKLSGALVNALRHHGQDLIIDQAITAFMSAPPAGKSSTPATAVTLGIFCTRTWPLSSRWKQLWCDVRDECRASVQRLAGANDTSSAGRLN